MASARTASAALKLPLLPNPDGCTVSWRHTGGPGISLARTTRTGRSSCSVSRGGRLRFQNATI